MFVCIGAAVDIPYHVYNLLGAIGAKLYFFRLPYTNKTTQDVIKHMADDFTMKYNKVQTALVDYLKWFEIVPDLVYDESTGISKMKWDMGKDSEQAKEWIADLSIALAHLRCVAKLGTLKIVKEARIMHILFLNLKIPLELQPYL